MTTEKTAERCKEKIFEGFHTYRCSRKSWRDGYCKQHHPDSVKARREESERRFKEKQENSPLSLLAKKNNELNQENAALRSLVGELVKGMKKIANLDYTNAATNCAAYSAVCTANECLYKAKEVLG